MIVIDTSALMAILLDEPRASECMETIEYAKALFISAGTLAEALIVAERKKVGGVMRTMLEDLELEIIHVTFSTAQRVLNAYQRWGKGIHPAGLNYGDCFAYALAEEKKCPLLYIGNDFLQTDIPSALALPN